MNYLQLCRRVYSEGGISGQINSTQNQTGEALRVVDWVAQAYRDILNDQGSVWNFTRKSFKQQLTSGKSVYTFAELGLTEGVRWDTRSMRVSIQSNRADETFLGHMRYRAFRDYWEFSSRRETTGRPLNVASDNDTNLRIAPIPDADYWITGEYEIAPEDLIENEDVPVFPSRFHMAIVWKALRSYGLFEAAPEVVARADMEHKTIMQHLYLDQTPEVVVGGPIC